MSDRKQQPPDVVSGRPVAPFSPLLRTAYRLSLRSAQAAAGVAVWQLLVSAFSIDPRIIPAPLDVLERLIAGLSGGTIVSAAANTLTQTISGFVIGSVLGVLLAIVLSESKVLRLALEPYIVALQAVPKLAMAPIFTIWFGFGMESKIALVVSILFFPVLVNTMAGLQSVQDDQLDLLRAYRASPLQILLRLKIFVAIPYIVAALEVGLVFGLTATVVVEMMGSGTTRGLGTLIKIYESQMDSSSVFAILVVLSVLGVALHSLIMAASSFLLRRYR